MQTKFHPKRFLTSFVVVFITHVIIVYLWDLFFHGQGTFNFGLSFVLALAIGAALSFSDTK